MTLSECDEHIGARVTDLFGADQGTITSTGNFAVYVQYDGQPQPVSAHPKNIQLLAEREAV